MDESFVDVVRAVRGGSESIAAGAKQIASGNADLSQRTEAQVANLQETAASMEELTSTVQAHSESTRTATQKASSASEVATQGGVVVDRVVSIMEGIVSSSKQITLPTLSAPLMESRFDQLDQVTQQNAALVEESAAAAGSLDGPLRKDAASPRRVRRACPPAGTPCPRYAWWPAG